MFTIDRWGVYTKKNGQSSVKKKKIFVYIIIIIIKNVASYIGIVICTAALSHLFNYK